MCLLAAGVQRNEKITGCPIGFVPRIYPMDDSKKFVLKLGPPQQGEILGKLLWKIFLDFMEKKDFRFYDKKILFRFYAKIRPLEPVAGLFSIKSKKIFFS